MCFHLQTQILNLIVHLYYNPKNKKDIGGYKCPSAVVYFLFFFF